MDKIIDAIILWNSRLILRYETTRNPVLAIFIILPVLWFSTGLCWLGAQYYRFINWITRKK